MTVNDWTIGTAVTRILTFGEGEPFTVTCDEHPGPPVTIERVESTNGIWQLTRFQLVGRPHTSSVELRCGRCGLVARIAGDRFAKLVEASPIRTFTLRSLIH
jgi:hypothetical protein